MNAVTEAVAEMPVPLVFSDGAANKVKQLIDEEGNAELKLRVFVTGGGCSGFQYGFTFDDAKGETDLVLKRDGATVLIDEVSLDLLKGSQIDYVEDMIGASFQITNPQAKSTCGCGNSFSV